MSTRKNKIPVEEYIAAIEKQWHRKQLKERVRKLRNSKNKIPGSMKLFAGRITLIDEDPFLRELIEIFSDES